MLFGGEIKLSDSHAEEQGATYFHNEGFNPNTNIPAPFEIVPDIVFFERVKKPWKAIVIFWDGPHHRTPSHRWYDEVIAFVLERNKVKVFRYDHNGVLTKAILAKAKADVVEYKTND